VSGSSIGDFALLSDCRIGERQPKAVPMLKGLDKFYEVLGDSGAVARRDLLHEVPPMYAMARVAARSLPSGGV
jgi:hypothetical protein